MNENGRINSACVDLDKTHKAEANKNKENNKNLNIIFVTHFITQLNTINCNK